MKLPVLEAVIKVGGSLLNEPSHHARVTSALGALGERHALLIVPGGGPLADAVRALDQRMGLGDEISHWMAVLAMDQHALLLAGRIANAVLAESPEEIVAARTRRRVPVLAPSRWLRAVDPLPHRWTVTSDSIAAWVAGALDAKRVVLVKSVEGPLAALADEHFAAALPPHVTASVLAASRIEELDALLG